MRLRPMGITLCRGLRFTAISVFAAPIVGFFLLIAGSLLAGHMRPHDVLREPGLLLIVPLAVIPSVARLVAPAAFATWAALRACARLGVTGARRRALLAMALNAGWPAFYFRAPEADDSLWSRLAMPAVVALTAGIVVFASLKEDWGE